MQSGSTATVRTPRATRSHRLGILRINATAMDVPGAVLAQGTWPCPTVEGMIPAATPSHILGPWSASLQEAFVMDARELVDRGATHLTSNCGFAVLYQDAVASATRVPTLLSALVLLPAPQRVYGSWLGLLTYDAERLTLAHLKAAGSDDSDALVVADVQESAVWRALGDDQRPPLDIDSMRRDLLGVAGGLVERSGAKCLLLECTGMCPFVPDLERALGVELFDLVRAIRFLIGDGSSSAMPVSDRTPVANTTLPRTEGHDA